MLWFKRKEKREKRIKVAKNATLEIVAAQEATEKLTKQAIEDAEKLKELLERNHFSATLYIAVGGTLPREKQRKPKHA